MASTQTGSWLTSFASLHEGLIAFNSRWFPLLDLIAFDCSFLDVTCFLQRDPGPCDQNYPGYYYDVTTHQCEKFVYGGCLGNANNFDTLEHCKARCHGYGQ